MTVYELIQKLVTLPADATVIIRTDAPNDLLKDYMSDSCGEDSANIDNYSSDLFGEINEWETVQPSKDNIHYCYLYCDLMYR